MSRSDSSSRIPVLRDVPLPSKQGVSPGEKLAVEAEAHVSQEVSSPRHAQVDELTGVRTRSGIAQRSEASDTELLLPRDSRSGAVFQQWLVSLASDAEAALAAAMSYRELSPEGRDQWLRHLASDALEVDVPKIAIFAPLLAVEADQDRKELLLELLGDEEDHAVQLPERAMVGRGDQGERVYVLATPLYLQFMQVLACGVRDGQFLWVRHDPIVKDDAAPRHGQHLGSALLEASPLKSVLDELASTILSHRRSGLPLPEALSVLAELLGKIGP